MYLPSCQALLIGVGTCDGPGRYATSLGGLVLSLSSGASPPSQGESTTCPFFWWLEKQPNRKIQPHTKPASTPELAKPGQGSWGPWRDERMGREAAVSAFGPNALLSVCPALGPQELSETQAGILPTPQTPLVAPKRVDLVCWAGARFGFCFRKPTLPPDPHLRAPSSYPQCPAHIDLDQMHMLVMTVATAWPMLYWASCVI